MAYYGEEDRVPGDRGHATVVRSANGVPVVAERILTYERARGRYQDLSAVLGTPFAAEDWLGASNGGGPGPDGKIDVLINAFGRAGPDSRLPGRRCCQILFAQSQDTSTIPPSQCDRTGQRLTPGKPGCCGDATVHPAGFINARCYGLKV